MAMELPKEWRGRGGNERRNWRDKHELSNTVLHKSIAMIHIFRFIFLQYFHRRLIGKEVSPEAGRP